MSRDLYIRYNKGGLWKDVHDIPYPSGHTFNCMLEKRTLTKVLPKYLRYNHDGKGRVSFIE